jgi:tetratricopeptide (TPR) repeat protein
MVRHPPYAREEVLRILEITPRQLRSWEAQGLVAAGQEYTFSDLLALKTVKKLREQNVSARRIQLTVASLKERLADVDQPLAQLRITAEGRRITVHTGGGRMDAMSGQLLLDFDAREIEKLRSFPVASDKDKNGEAGSEAAREQLSEYWFQRGLALEETGAPVEDAVAAYRKAIEANPNASGALVNLGTIAFRMRRMKEAAAFYQRALDADATYPLAHFNLGNLYDEQGDLENAGHHYREAIRLNPRYADAWFNLALLCERRNDLLQAVSCWQTYLKLDSTSSWAGTARKQIERLKKTLRSK